MRVGKYTLKHFEKIAKTLENSTATENSKKTHKLYKLYKLYIGH